MDLQGLYKNVTNVRVVPGQKTGTDFGSIYNSYYQKCYHDAFFLLRSREPAEDLVQDVFEKVWVNWGKEVILDWPGYLFIMVRNRGLSILRKSRSKQVAFKDISSAIAHSTSHLLIEEICCEHTYQQLLQEAISKLPAQRKKVFVLGKIEGWSRDEIATYLGLSPNTVKATMQEAISDVGDYIFAKTGLTRRPWPKKELRVCIKSKLLKAA